VPGPFNPARLRAHERTGGVQPTVGFWDPLGPEVGGGESDSTQRREVEVQHGRVTTFAAVTPEFARIVNLLMCRGIKLFDYCENIQCEGHPGNYSAGLDLGSAGVVPGPIADEETRVERLDPEVANNDLAMVAIGCMFFQDALIDSAWSDWACCHVCYALRSHARTGGVQPAVSFWDPLDHRRFCRSEAGGSASDSARRREVELRHGRVAMVTAIGRANLHFNLIYGIPMPSYGIKVARGSNGSVVLSKVPRHGWAQSVTFLGGFELSDYLDTIQVRGRPGTPASGLFGLGSVDIVPDPVGAETMRNSPTAVTARFDPLRAKVAYCRLATTAIIGMFFQDILIGSVWVDSAPPWRHGAADAPLRSGMLETYMARRRRGEQPRVPLASSAPSRPTPWRPSVPGPSRRR